MGSPTTPKRSCYRICLIVVPLTIALVLFIGTDRIASGYGGAKKLRLSTEAVTRLAPSPPAPADISTAALSATEISQKPSPASDSRHDVPVVLASTAAPKTADLARTAAPVELSSNAGSAVSPSSPEVPSIAPTEEPAEVVPDPPSAPLVAVETRCRDDLVGFTTDDVTAVFRHATTRKWRREALSRQKLPVLGRSGNRTYAVAACLHQSEGILGHWFTEMVKLLLALARHDSMANLFVSIYQSGSSDATPQLLEKFGQALNALGVKNSIVLGNEVRGGMNRIEFLARVRNHAMTPIMEADKDFHFDRVFWLSDNFYCASGPLQQFVVSEDPVNGGSGADATCALDFDFINWGQCGFYDIWAAHDYNGRNFMKPFPYVSHDASIRAVQANKPFQAFACWSGMVVYRAEIFTKHGLLFRRGRAHLGECPVAETEIIFHDMWKLGKNRIAVAPNVFASYGGAEYNSCVVGKQQSIELNQNVEFSTVVPEEFSCCPIDEDATFVNFGACNMQKWNGPYDAEGIPRRQGFPKRRLQSVNSSSILQQDLSPQFPTGRAALLPFPVNRSGRMALKHKVN